MEGTSWSLILLLAHTGATLYMTGLIWFVQLVHYPLFARVGSEQYRAYQDAHMRRTTIAVSPLFFEAATAPLLFWYPPAAAQPLLLWLLLALVAVNLLSTALLQAPFHGKLLAGFDAALHRRLVQSNWIRTIAWSARSLLLGWIFLQILPTA